MSSQGGWRFETDAVDYFGNQKKKLDVADRRPVVRRAADLVGPGIGPEAVRLPDFDGQLASLNGLYSAEANTPNAPVLNERFVGYVVADSELGGVQVFTSLVTGLEYSRPFLKSAGNQTAALWGQWTLRDQTESHFPDGLTVGGPDAGSAETSISDTGDITTSGMAVAEGQPFRHRYRLAAQTVAGNAWTSIATTNEGPGNVGGITLIANQFYVPVTGVYEITGSAVWQSATGGRRMIAVFVNDISRIADEEVGGTAAIYQSISHIVHMNAGDYASVRVYQNSGVNQNLLASGDGAFNHQSITLLH